MAFLNKLLFSLTLLVGITAVNAQVQPAVNKQTCIEWYCICQFEGYSNDFVYDMKYATEDNFLKAKVYGCAGAICAWKQLLPWWKPIRNLSKKGYRIKLFLICYRPLDIQKMWEIVSNPKLYVADQLKVPQ
jgi:D-alanyl-D-alanine dipeptidase